MKLDANTRRRIARRSNAIARRESPTKTVAPAFVIRAAIESGYGRPGAPLTDALRGQKAAGVRMTDAEWQASVEAMVLGGHLYTSGGRWVLVEAQ